MGTLRIHIGGHGPVVAESDVSGWRLFVHGQLHGAGADPDDLHIALRELALRDRALARDAFGVICNCIGAWEDEYTDEHGEDALLFEDWMERIEYLGDTFVNVDGELIARAPVPGRTAPRVGDLYRTNTLIPQEFDESIGAGTLVEVLLNQSIGGSDVRVVETGREFFCPWGNLVPDGR